MPHLKVDVSAVQIDIVIHGLTRVVPLSDSGGVPFVPSK